MATKNTECFDFQNYLEGLDKNGYFRYSFMLCDCAECAPRNWVAVGSVADVMKLVKHFGFDRMLSQVELKQLHHAVRLTLGSVKKVA